MTEAEWLACTDPKQMLGALRKRSVTEAFSPSYRKLLLFATSYGREYPNASKCPLLCSTVEVADAFADGLTDYEPIHALWQEMETVIARTQRRSLVAESCQLLAWRLICELLSVSTPGILPTQRSSRSMRGAKRVNQAAIRLGCGSLTGKQRKLYKRLIDLRHSKILRDIFGLLPFRLVIIDAAWLTRSVTRLATAVYDKRILPSGELDTARLAVLADALEEAGCQDADILGHLRSPGTHVRGCWVLDAVLGKS